MSVVHSSFPPSLLFAFVFAMVTIAHAQAANDDQPRASEKDNDQPVIDVTVRGSRVRSPASSRDPTAASTVISGASLRCTGCATAEVLSQAPGVQITRTGSGAELATASIRGATSAQTPVLLAGIPINDDVAGTADLSLIPLWMIDRVEVFRGHAPGFAGQLGLGGAVFFEPRLPSRSGGGLSQTVGSYGELSTAITGSLKAKGAAALIALQHAQARNDYPYTDDRGTRFETGDDVRRRRDNADFVMNDAWAVGRMDLGTGADLTIVGNALDREQGVTGLAVVPAHHARASVQRGLTGLTTRVPCAAAKHGEAQGPCLLSLSSAVVTAHTRLSDPLGELSLPSEHVSTKAIRFLQQAQIQHRLGDNHEIGVLGSQAIERLGIDLDDRQGLQAARYTTRLAASATFALSPDASIHGVGGAECHTTQGSGPSSSCGVFEPYGRAGARWLAAPWLLLLGNAGHYIRPPTLGELYGTSPTVRGTPTLVAENGQNLDAGVRLSKEGQTSTDLAAHLEAFVFSRWVNDLIAYQRTSFGVIRPFNVGSARFVGIEIATRAVWLNHLRHDLTVTLLDPRDTTDGNALTNDILPFQSRMMLSNRFEVFSEPAWSALRLDRAAIALRLQHRSSRFADPAGLIVIDAHTTFDVEESMDFFDRSLSVRLALRNLFDQPQFDTVGYPLPARSYHATFEAWF